MQEELARGDDIAHCPSCSLTVVVIYNQVLIDGPTCGYAQSLRQYLAYPHLLHTELPKKCTVLAR